MRNEKIIPIIAAVITAITSIIVAIINSNTMKDVLLTEIMATQSAEAYLTAVVSNEIPTQVPTLTPFQPITLTPLPTFENQISTPSPASLPQSTTISTPIIQTQLSPVETTPEDRLTFRFYELSILIFFLGIVGTLIFAATKTSDFTHENSLSVLPISLVMVSPFILLFIRYSFSVPSLPWTTILFSAFLPISVFLWFKVLEIVDRYYSSSVLIFIPLAIIAPFVLSFGFTFWPLGIATLNALITVVVFGIIVFVSLVFSDFISYL